MAAPDDFDGLQLGYSRPTYVPATPPVYGADLLSLQVQMSNEMWIPIEA